MQVCRIIFTYSFCAQKCSLNTAERKRGKSLFLKEVSQRRESWCWKKTRLTPQKHDRCITQAQGRTLPRLMGISIERNCVLNPHNWIQLHFLSRKYKFTRWKPIFTVILWKVSRFHELRRVEQVFECFFQSTSLTSFWPSVAMEMLFVCNAW